MQGHGRRGQQSHVRLERVGGEEKKAPLKQITSQGGASTP
jgi:hypothetical protein